MSELKLNPEALSELYEALAATSRLLRDLARLGFAPDTCLDHAQRACEVLAKARGEQPLGDGL